MKISGTKKAGYPKYVKRVSTLLTASAIHKIKNCKESEFLEVEIGSLVQVVLVNGKELIFTIPSGFIYNGASIPATLKPLVGSGKEEWVKVGSCVHDYLYSFGSDLGGALSYQVIMDEIFYLLLRRDATSTSQKIKAALFFAGVRAFGFLFKNSKESAALLKLMTSIECEPK